MLSTICVIRHGYMRKYVLLHDEEYNITYLDFCYILLQGI